MNTKRDPQDKFSFNEVPFYVVTDIIKMLKTPKSPGFENINSLVVTAVISHTRPPVIFTISKKCVLVDVNQMYP